MTDQTNSDTTIKLTKPLTTHSGEVSVLTLKEPTAGCVIDYGDPFKTRPIKDANGNPSFEFDYDNKAVLHVLTEMVEPRVDDLLLRTICVADFYELRMKATHFLIGIAGKNPT